MSVTTYGQLKAWAMENCPDEFAKLPRPDVFDIKVHAVVGDDWVTPHLMIGEVARTAIYRDLIDFEDNNIPVNVYLEKIGGALMIKAGGIRLTRPHYGKIKLFEPFCWIWPNIFDSIGIAKLNVLARYAFLVRGHSGRLESMSFKIQQVFPQLCADIARGQGIKKMKSVWKGVVPNGRSIANGDGEDKETDGRMGEDATSLDDSIIDQQPRRGVTFQDRIGYLTDEFDAFISTLQIDYEGQTADKTKLEMVVSELKEDLCVANVKIDALEIELEDSQKDALMWEKRYAKLKGIRKFEERERLL